MTPSHLLRAALATLFLALAALCHAEDAAQGRPDLHNPLELFQVANVQLALENSSVRLHVNATALERSGTWFEVVWTGVQSPRLDDLVALYAPADADPRKAAPVSVSGRVGAG